MNWNPSKEPQHQEFFDYASNELEKGRALDPFTWRCRQNTQLAGDPFLFKRGASAKHAGIFASGTIAEDRGDDHIVELLFDFVAPLGGEYPLSKLRELDAPLLKIVPSGCRVSTETATTIARELKKTTDQRLQTGSATPEPFREGHIREVVQNKRERNRKARQECLDHFGDEICRVCDVNFWERYGEMGRILHVHHREDLALRGQSNTNPTKDLVPVCPNCHAMLHFTIPAMSTTKLRQILSKPRQRASPTRTNHRT